MPSPSILSPTTITTVATIAKASHHSSHSVSYLPPPPRSKKLESSLPGAGPVALTEEALQVFENRHESLYEKRRLSSTSYSPYYKGLTDYSLVIKRESHSSAPSPASPKSEWSSVSSGSRSSFGIGVKIQDLWLSVFKKEDKSLVEKTSPTVSGGRKSSRSRGFSSSSSASVTSSMTTLGEALVLDGFSYKDRRLTLKKKSLRERFPESPATPAKQPLVSLVKPRELKPADAQALADSLLRSPPPTPDVLTSSTPLLPSARNTAAKAVLMDEKEEIGAPPPPKTMPSKSVMVGENEAVDGPAESVIVSVKEAINAPARGMPAKGVMLDEKEGIIRRDDRGFGWADKYRPKALKNFICNRNKALQLQALARAGDYGHFIFEGPTGVGKRTMIWALLQEAYGPEKVKAKKEFKPFVLKGEAVGPIQLALKVSQQHVEVNLSEVKGYEKHVIVELIHETSKMLSKIDSQSDGGGHRVIIIYEADELSTDVLLYIKWLLERDEGYNRVFFCCTNGSKLQPMRPLCTVVPLLPPSNDEIVEVLKFIAQQEHIELPDKLAERIANDSKNNLRQAIRSLEATWQTCSSLKEGQEIMTGWEDDIANIARNIVEEQSPKQMYLVRGNLQNLIQHNVSPEFIFVALVEELKKHLVEELRTLTDNLYKKYQNFAKIRTEEVLKKYNDPVKKNLYHFLTIEEFIAKFMSLYKISVVNKRDKTWPCIP